MNLTDILITLIGPTLGRFLLARWLGNTFVAEELTGSIGDIISKLSLDRRTKNKAERVFSEIGEEIAESLVIMFNLEGLDFSDDRKLIVTKAVAETLPKITVDNALGTLLLKFDLQPDMLHKYLLKKYPHQQHLEHSEQQLYERVVLESCRRIIAISAELPNFQLPVLTELLKSSRQLENTAEMILEKVNHVYEDSFNQRDEASLQEKRFEHNYRQAITRKLDYVELIGLDIRGQTSHKQPLSIAYISLNLRGDAIEALDISAPRALSEARRHLILGEAGSGKTTLLKWIAVRIANNDFGSTAPEMNEWQGTVPFFIRLRDFASKERSFPNPEEWPGLIAPQIVETMPTGWVHEQLESGRAVVLVDGLDELSNEKQQLAFQWLDDIMSLYFKPRYFVSSRPESVNMHWPFVGIHKYQISNSPTHRLTENWQGQMNLIEIDISEQWSNEEKLRDKYQNQSTLLQGRKKELENVSKKNRNQETSVKALRKEESQLTAELKSLETKLRNLRPYSFFEKEKRVRMQQAFQKYFQVFKNEVLNELNQTWGCIVHLPEEISYVSEEKCFSVIATGGTNSQLANTIIDELSIWLQWAKEVWMPTLRVQRMSSHVVDEFVIHWHKAVAVSEGNLPIQQKELEEMANQFINALNNNGSIRELATTPLLCAMLCALHRDRQQELPSDRINLYQACLDTMLTRRDEKRGVDLIDYPKLSHKQKRYLLQDLAYWMMVNEYTASAPKNLAEQRIEHRLTDLIAKENAQSNKIMEYFINRTGIIREPVSEQIDFAHRTFQEFLCAEAVAFGGDTRSISAHFWDNEWHEIIVLLAGLVSKQELDWMLNKMLLPNIRTIVVSNQEENRRIHILALDCLSTDPILGESAQKAIQKHSLAARPPKSQKEAKLFGKAKDLATPSLACTNKNTDEEILYSIEALIMIGSTAALDQLEKNVNKIQDKFPIGKPTAIKNLNQVKRVNFKLDRNLRIPSNLHTMLGGIIQQPRKGNRARSIMTLKNLNKSNQISPYITQTLINLFRAWSVWDESEVYAKKVLQPLLNKTKYLLLNNFGFFIKALECLDLSRLEHIEFENTNDVPNWDDAIVYLWNLNYLTEISFVNDVDITTLLPLARLPRIRRINVPVTTKLTDNIKKNLPVKHFDEP